MINKEKTIKLLKISHNLSLIRCNSKFKKKINNFHRIKKLLRSQKNKSKVQNIIIYNYKNLKMLQLLKKIKNLYNNYKIIHNNQKNKFSNRMISYRIKKFKSKICKKTLSAKNIRNMSKNKQKIVIK